MAIHFQQLWETIFCFFISEHFQGLDGSWRRAEAGRCSNAAYADFDPSSPAECKDPLDAAASTLLIAFVINVILQHERERILTICVCLQAQLLEALHCMAQASPIAVIGETIWGDEVGAVYVLQVEVFSAARVCFISYRATSRRALTLRQMQRSVQHLADSLAAFRSYVQRTPQLLIDSLSSELYAAASIATDASPEHPLYIELTSTILPSRKFASATFVSAHTR
jgi:hypothetical protein